MKTVLIRADSSSEIGTGHIMRDLVLAKQFSDARVIFATRPLEGNIGKHIFDAGYGVIWLESDELDELAGVVKKEKVDTLVIDHYGINQHYECLLKNHTGATLFVLDDTYERHYCDILLNHNVYADPARYNGLVPKCCELRCGTEYTLLRDEFVRAKVQKELRPPPPWSILIAMGGADHLGLNVPILEILEKFEQVQAHVVTTTANRNLEQLKKYAAGNSRVSIHVNTSKMATLMSCSHLVIATPSVTMNEILYMGVDFIAIQTADNQREMTKYLHSTGETILSDYSARELISALNMKLYG